MDGSGYSEVFARLLFWNTRRSHPTGAGIRASAHSTETPYPKNIGNGFYRAIVELSTCCFERKREARFARDQLWTQEHSYYQELKLLLHY